MDRELRSPEYTDVLIALRDMNKPIGVSECKFMQELPRELRDALPNAEIFGERVLKEMEVEYKRSDRK